MPFALPTAVAGIALAALELMQALLPFGIFAKEERRLHAEAKALLERFGERLAPRSGEAAFSFSYANRRRIEIARALAASDAGSAAAYEANLRKLKADGHVLKHFTPSVYKVEPTVEELEVKKHGFTVFMNDDQLSILDAGDLGVGIGGEPFDGDLVTAGQGGRQSCQRAQPGGIAEQQISRQQGHVHARDEGGQAGNREHDQAEDLRGGPGVLGAAPGGDGFGDAVKEPLILVQRELVQFDVAAFASKGVGV